MGLLGLFLGRKKSQSASDRRRSLAAKPLRNSRVKWKEEEGLVVLTMPMKKTLGTRIGTRMFQAPPERNLELDVVGSEIWVQCDGTNRTLDLIEYMRSRYQFSHKEAMLSVTEYLRQLGRRGLIGLVVDKSNEDEGSTKRR